LKVVEENMNVRVWTGKYHRRGERPFKVSCKKKYIVVCIYNRRTGGPSSKLNQKYFIVNKYCEGKVKNIVKRF